MPNEQESKVAYFSMEVGLNSKIPTYSGGLGILAGDLLKAASDLEFPMVGMTLISKYGYFFQNVEQGKQLEEPVIWSIDDFLKPVDKKVKVTVCGEKVTVGCWLYEIIGVTGFTVPLFFLTTDLPENSAEARGYTDSLYGGGSKYRLQQELILGVAGIRMLNELGYKNIKRYHMNEGHSALLSTELLRTLGTPEKVKEKCVFTTHTPVPAGHDKFDMDLVKEVLGQDLYDLLKAKYPDHKQLNMTELALDSSNYINGVAKKHTEVSKTMFPNYPIHSITNGVHAQTWVSPHFRKLYDSVIPAWRANPAALRSATSLSTVDIVDAHLKCKHQIIDFANSYSNAGLDYDNFTIGWARRFTSYKRPDFLLESKDRLMEIADKVGPIQVIYSGKAHPHDNVGKELIKTAVELSKELKGSVKTVYLENYDMYLSKFITSGVDVWLNTPLPPHEASGTSGMKCALNGVPHLSVKDGWWVEGCVEGETGWSFETPEELYNLLETQIIPTFYNDSAKWVEIMKKTISLNGSFFNAHRMIMEYITNAYRV